MKRFDAEVIRSVPITDEQLAVEFQADGSNSGSKVIHRLGWARTYLKKAGLIDNPARGEWSLTDEAHCTCNAQRRLQQASVLGPEVTERVEVLRQQTRAAYAAMIEKAKARGEVADEIPTEVAAAMIDIECNAVLTHMLAGEDPRLLKAQALLAFSTLT